MSTKCSDTTRTGDPCRAWAIRNSDPPRCAAHAGRAHAPARNQNAATHGFYSNVLQPDELADIVTYGDDMTLDDEIACARVALRRILTLINTSAVATYEDPDNPRALTPTDYARLAGLALQGTRTVARLLRHKRALSGEAADNLLGAVGIALSELATEMGIDL